MVETHSWNLEIRRAELHAPQQMLEGNLYGSAFFGADHRFASTACRPPPSATLRKPSTISNSSKPPAPPNPIEEETVSPDLGFVPSTLPDPALFRPEAPTILPPASPEVTENTPTSPDVGFVPSTPSAPPDYARAEDSLL
jgi:hypothetical protein